MTSEEKTTIENRLTTIEKRLDRVLFILESDHSLNSKGLVESVKDNTKALEIIKMENKVKKAENTIYGVIGGFILMVSIKLAELFFTNK